MSFAQKTAASLAAISFVATATLMAVPWHSARPIVSRWLKPTLPLLYNIGLHHQLVLFSPSPPKWTGRVDFRVTYSDGAQQNWIYPRSRLAPLDPRGTYRRYLFYYTVWSFRHTARLLQPSLAAYIADDSYTPTRRPVKVEMIERFARIPSPKDGLGQPAPTLDQETVLLSYDVAKRQAQVLGKPTVW